MASTAPSISQAKKALRNDIKSRLSDLPGTEIARQSRDVTDQVVELPVFEQAKRISVYLSMPTGEISTDAIVRQALLQGKKVFVPFIQKSPDSNRSHSYMEMFALRSQDDLENLQPDSWGIPTLDKASLRVRENAMGGSGPSPSTDDNLEEGNPFRGLDLILLPGMAFDHSGGRLGHGKGFYDRFLQDYWKRATRKDGEAKLPSLVGLALKQQLLPPGNTIPTTTDDWKVDSVITSR